MHISDQKQKLRTAIEHRLKALSTNKRDAESRTACRELLKMIPKDAVVCAYWALKTEVNLGLLIEELEKRNQTIYLPVYDNKLTYKLYTGKGKLIQGALKIYEPPSSAPDLNPHDADIILIPGRAFDRSGNRMGRGNAGYDRWITKQRKKNPNTQYWGVALECQVVNEVPVEVHDEPMDKIVTARGLVKYGPSSGSR